MHFSSSLSLLTNSCASRLVRPSSILSVDLTAGGGGQHQAPPALRPTSPDPYSPWALGLRRCRVMGCPALTPPPTWDRTMPLMLARLRAASPAKSFVDSQS